MATRVSLTLSNALILFCLLIALWLGEALTWESGRVAPGSRPPGAPTDPDVRD